MKTFIRIGLLLCAGTFLALAAKAGSAGLTLTPNQPGAVYPLGKKIIWRVQVRQDVLPVATLAYVLKRGGGTVMGQGRLDLKSGSATIETSLAEPGTILTEVTGANAAGKPLHALAGVAVAPEKIPVSSPCPDDFDAFWTAKLNELAAVPEHPVLAPGRSNKAGVDYWKLTLDNIRGTHIYGQLARPAGKKKLPAMLIVQWAGVYPLSPTTVTGMAAQGWLALNISAHDLPIDEPAAFYENLTKGALTNYPAIGNDDREKSYFLRMFLACHRAVDYLAERPDWDGRTLVVTGTSQGGLQSFVAAGLNHKVTGLMALVPAGCDDTGDLAGRNPGWPYWMAHAGHRDSQKVRDTARYFDGVNFAARVQCPALVGLGLIDTTSPPSGVFAAINQLKGPKEVVVLPEANHHGDNKTHAAYLQRAGEWQAALVKGAAAPVADWK